MFEFSDIMHLMNWQTFVLKLDALCDGQEFFHNEKHSPWPNLRMVLLVLVL